MDDSHGSTRRPVNSARALELLKEGNQRYVLGDSQSVSATPEVRHTLAAEGQSPFAAILGCADSRVPPEIIFDAGIGGLFVVRTAGNTADAIATGSVEFAVERLHVRLIVVLGHQDCGAVTAAVSGGTDSPNMAAIVAEIQPSLDEAREAEAEPTICKYEDANIRHTVSKLKGSPLLAQRVQDGSLKIVGSKYDLKTGEVCFWD
ncbi:MAG: carbonic anhydrase [Coriobacteriia bacterium]|nr:carbonic anhydrase [Coriobacteriia bacterium]